MNNGAPENNKSPIDKALEEILSSIPSSDRPAFQSILDRAVEAALAQVETDHQSALARAETEHQSALGQAEARHEVALAEALDEAEHRHQAAMAEIEERHKAEIKALHEKFALERQRLYGRKSERQSSQPPVFDEAEVTAQSSTEADDQAGIPPEPDVDQDAASASNKKAAIRARGKRRPIPPHVRRVDVLIELPEDKRLCAGCNQPMAEIGEQISEQIDIIPLQFVVTRFHRKRYACGHREHKPVIAPRPPQVLPKSNATNAFLAMLMTMKYVDGLPLARIEHIFERMGLKVPRVTQARWVIQSAEQLKPLAEALWNIQLEADHLLMDETPVQVLKEKGRDPTTKSYMWIQRGGPKGKTVVRFTYDPRRSGDVPARLLKNWKGYLMTDGYGGYNQIGGKDGVELMACWVHARRKFMDAIKVQDKEKKGRDKKGRAHEAVALIAELYAVEKAFRKASDEDRYQARQSQSKPILDRIKAWLDQNAEGTPPKGALGEAIGYSLNYWPRLIRFIERGDLHIDNNACENAIRPFVIGRKAWLFSDTTHGAEASALIYSLVETAKASGHEPHSWLNHVMRELPKAREMKSYDHLLPWNLSADDLIRDAYLAEAPTS